MVWICMKRKIHFKWQEKTGPRLCLNRNDGKLILVRNSIHFIPSSGRMRNVLLKYHQHQSWQHFAELIFLCVRECCVCSV